MEKKGIKYGALENTGTTILQVLLTTHFLFFNNEINTTCFPIDLYAELCR